MIDNILFFKEFFLKNKRALGIENADQSRGVGLSAQRRMVPCLDGEITITYNNN
jgi:hypothetical protein